VPKPSPFHATETTVKEVALRYPGAHEDHPWGHTAIKVKGKVFVILGGTAEMLSVTCKLPTSGRMALLLPFASPTGYGLGKSGWVTAQFAPGDPVPIDRLCEWVDESYRAVAPKKLVAELDGAPAAAPKAVKPTKARKRKA
jgi:predicted DNA-binding protein (MmcQ/YjbR family)